MCESSQMEVQKGIEQQFVLKNEFNAQLEQKNEENKRLQQ